MYDSPDISNVMHAATINKHIKWKPAFIEVFPWFCESNDHQRKTVLNNLKPSNEEYESNNSNLKTGVLITVTMKTACS